MVLSNFVIADLERQRREQDRQRQREEDSRPRLEIPLYPDTCSDIDSTENPNLIEIDL